MTSTVLSAQPEMSAPPMTPEPNLTIQISFAHPTLHIHIPQTGKFRARLRKYQKRFITDGTEGAEALKGKIREVMGQAVVIESVRLDREKEVKEKKGKLTKEKQGEVKSEVPVKMTMSVVLVSASSEDKVDGTAQGPAFEKVLDLSEDEYEYFINACRK
ncbi:hypothetical protein SCHPADRAFT_989164 [Schizopora paradoxa]|uniref:Uncharacterized protein n=1 Tax=Schizopora paradoxa TaxID=27342 RepID=A0A0H2RJP4_9AGAM|nr:hypothetical protein SCHPADRAFT_989164 [Schizopora paradoxa]